MRILASSTVLFTILLSLAFGIACGFAAVYAVLHALGHRPVKREAAPSSVAVVTTASGN